MELLGNSRHLFAENISRYRKLLGWNQHDLAEASGVHVNALRTYEQENRWPDPETIDALASALRVNPSELFKAHDTQEPNINDIKRLHAAVAALESPLQFRMAALAVEGIASAHSAAGQAPSIHKKTG
jgi:transcriptional regulator with XRE-family HTH domain